MGLIDLAGRAADGDGYGINWGQFLGLFARTTIASVVLAGIEGIRRMLFTIRENLNDIANLGSRAVGALLPDELFRRAGSEAVGALPSNAAAFVTALITVLVTVWVLSKVWKVA